MKNTYTVSLVNNEGCQFDKGEFTNLKEARQWATGRGQTEEHGKWYDYTVFITKNSEPYKEYQTR